MNISISILSITLISVTLGTPQCKLVFLLIIGFSNLFILSSECTVMELSCYFFCPKCPSCSYFIIIKYLVTRLMKIKIAQCQFRPRNGLSNCRRRKATNNERLSNYLRINVFFLKSGSVH